MSDADKQISSTKRILEINTSVDSLLIIFDGIPRILSDVIFERVVRCFDETRDSADAYQHVDFVVFACHLKDMLVNGKSHVNGHATRTAEGRSINYARQVLNALKSHTVNPLPRMSSEEQQVITQLKPNIFSP